MQDFRRIKTDIEWEAGAEEKLCTIVAGPAADVRRAMLDIIEHGKSTGGTGSDTRSNTPRDADGSPSLTADNITAAEVSALTAVYRKFSTTIQERLDSSVVLRQKLILRVENSLGVSI